MAHRLLGYALGDTEGIEPDEEVLLVLDSNDRAGMLWGDCGRLYFVLHPGALAAGRWGEVRVGCTD